MKKFWNVLSLPAAVLFLGLASPALAGKIGLPVEPPIRPVPPIECRAVCPDPYPVCGVDGKTYDNRCDAECARVEVAHKGQCDCVCPAVWNPVCGEDGNTYGNGCEAACAGVPVDHRGECGGGSTFSTADDAGMVGSTCYTSTLPRDPCYCPHVVAPVCGGDGNTYGNSCEAGCAGVCVAYEGECIERCNCPAVEDPVCGVDGRTYGNSCHAACAGVEVKYKGRCESDSAN